jgi:antitoxin component YwqK of YwqJK toxin-antitoxin module
MKKVVILFFLISRCTSESVLNNNDGSKVVSIYKKDKIFKTIYYNSKGFKTFEKFNYVSENYTQTKSYNDFGVLEEEILYTKFEPDTVLFGSYQGNYKLKILSVPSFEQKLFYEDGNLKSIGFFKRAKRDSVFKYFDIKGKLLYEEYYSMDSLVKKIDY